MKKNIISLLAFSLWLLAFPVGVFAQAATLSLDPAVGTFNRGCSYTLNIVLDTSGTQTDGTDAILLYDAARFNATSITNGTIYPDYPGNNIDAQNGKITVSGLASVSTPFSGKGTLATINFTVQTNAPTDATQIKFDFDPNNKAKTTDSNVVERGTLADVLNGVTNGNYTIGAGSCAGAPTPRPRGGNEAATPSATYYNPPPVKKVLPDTGTAELTSTVAILGGVLTILGILGLALL